MWFYQNHPEWAAMDSSWLNEDGDYDNNNNWHNAYWWHQNNPDYFYANHPNWISWYPNWRNEDGAYDGQHNWHYGQWWYNQNPNWVSANHPNWISQHSNWANHTEVQDHRAVMRTENEGNQRATQQAAVQKPRECTGGNQSAQRGESRFASAGEPQRAGGARAAEPAESHE